MVNAQQISFSDLMQAARCNDKNCFNALALQKKYFFFTVQTDIYSDTYVYTNNKDLNSKTAIDFSISFFKPPINSEIATSAALRHYLKDYFLVILKQAAEENYIADKTVKDPAAYFGMITYKSKKYPNYFLNVTVRKDERGLTQYFMEVQSPGKGN